MHQSTLKLFNEKDHLPIRLYKPWVTYFRQLKQITTNISQKINIYQSKHIRDQQIQDLLNISPDKKSIEIIAQPTLKEHQSASKNGGNNPLADLLFSNRE